MFNSIKSWFSAHATAILATLVAVSKAGLLGKVAVTLGTVIGGVLSAS